MRVLNCVPSLYYPQKFVEMEILWLIHELETSDICVLQSLVTYKCHQEKLNCYAKVFQKYYDSTSFACICFQLKKNTGIPSEK